MTNPEAMTSLELERSFFDSAEIEILSTAFEKAWCFVEFDPLLSVLDASERQSELARCLMAVLKFGESSIRFRLRTQEFSLLRKNQIGALLPKKAVAA